MTALLSLHGVQKAFAGKPVLRDLTLHVDRGEILYVIGTSGVGKSVGIKLVIGLLRVDAGEIWFDGTRIDTLPERALAAVRLRIGMVFQNATLFDAMTLADNVALPLRKHRGLRSAAARAEALRLLDDVGMGADAHALPGPMSDGMRKRAAIARTLAMRPDLIMYDEPTTGLDPQSARRIDEVIRADSRQRGAAAIVVSHDLPSIMGVADRVAMLYQGRVHAIGTPHELRTTTDPIVRQFLAGEPTGPMETPGY